MAQISFALLEAWLRGTSVDAIAQRLNLTSEFVAERIEAARLCLLLAPDAAAPAGE
jgi:hypothetical protein